MKYLMLVLTEPIADPIEGDDDPTAWVEEHDATGARFFGDRLAPASQARTVRVRRDGTSVTDGPFAETHEHIAGLDILECGSLDEAVQVALGHPMARGGVLEVRPFYDWSEEDA
ncbi:YciI family protein [Demequina activiva]|uniref:Transcription initiation protein n=1 Tax=Demequina activiva TaxID=1582364 RepID=A0A919UGS6_9MICO|nr:YciI family protein [Demequina activiva]GIG55152.1 transcription initiation protein [Demequina activiva]